MTAPTAPPSPLNRLQRWWRGAPDPTVELLLDRQSDHLRQLLHVVERLVGVTQEQSRLSQTLLDSFSFKGPQDAPTSRTFEPELDLVSRMEQEGLLGEEEAQLYRQDLLSLLKRSR